MATFGNWLYDQTRREDEVGQFARFYRDSGTSGARGKIHSPASVLRWAEQVDADAEMGTELVAPLCIKAQEEYRERRGDLRVISAEQAAGGTLEVMVAELLERVKRIEQATGAAPFPELLSASEHVVTIPLSPLAQQAAELASQAQYLASISEQAGADAGADMQAAVQHVTIATPDGGQMTASWPDGPTIASGGPGAAGQRQTPEQALAGTREAAQRAAQPFLRHADFGRLYREADFTEESG